MNTLLARRATGLAVATAVFVAIAVDVFAGTVLTGIDVEVVHGLASCAAPALTATMLAVTTVNSTVAIAVYASLIVLYESWQGRQRRATLMLLCVGGGLLLNDVLKHVFERTRPLLEHPRLSLETYSFPSGHAAASTLLYGLLLSWLFNRTRRSGWRVLGAAAATAAVALVAFSRLYLGVHFLSDVVAGCAEALAWIAASLIVMEAVWPETTDAARDGPTTQPH